jgi:hypothetical protein
MHPGRRIDRLRSGPFVVTRESCSRVDRGAEGCSNVDNWDRPDLLVRGTRYQVAPRLLVHSREVRSESDRGEDHHTGVSQRVYGQCRRALPGHTGVSGWSFVPIVGGALRRSDLVPRVAQRLHRHSSSIRRIRSTLLSQSATPNSRVSMEWQNLHIVSTGLAGLSLNVGPVRLLPVRVLHRA